MALTDYLQTTRRLLNDAGFARFNDFDLREWVGIARGQIAGEGECIRVYGTLAVTAAAQQYPFSAIAFPAGTTGVQAPINVRMITYGVPAATGQAPVTSREWEWFNQYVLAQPAPIASRPRVWAQFGQGVNGTIFINLLNGPYTLSVDTVCYPSPLTNNSDPEAIPYLWTDAVPYFAAYLALLTAGNAEAAAGMFKLYQMFVMRARTFATPSVLPGQYAQGPDPEMAGPGA